MEVVNPESSFVWTKPLDIHGIPMMGSPEKQGMSFSREGWLAAQVNKRLNPDLYGSAGRSHNRPLSAPYLAIARQDYAERHVVPFPRYFIIEPTNICNRKCPFCPITMMERKTPDGTPFKGHMPWFLFHALMTECGQHDVYGLSLYQLGESLLWKDTAGGPHTFVDMIKTAKTVGGFRVVNVSTNGDVANLDSLLDAPLDDLIVSIDGTTQEVYAANRPSTSGDDQIAFTRTVRRVREFLEEKVRRKKPGPYVRLQIINKDNTAAQIVSFIRDWITLPGVDDVFVKHLDSMRPWLGDKVVSDLEDAQKAARVGEMACQHLWAIGSMTVTGQFNACCHDAKTELTTSGSHMRVSGSVFASGMSFREWWSGPFMTQLRKDHSGGTFRKPCADCRERDPWLG